MTDKKLEERIFDAKDWIPIYGAGHFLYRALNYIISTGNIIGYKGCSHKRSIYTGLNGLYHSAFFCAISLEILKLMGK